MRQTKVWTNWAVPREAVSKHVRFALFGATAALLVACSAPAADPIGTIQQAASTPFANDQTAYWPPEPRVAPVLVSGTNLQVL